MPRTSRASVGGICYHVINRGNARGKVFHSQTDYKAFVELVEQAGDRVPMRVLAYCLMPNHFHLVLWPYADGDLSAWMQWVLTAHVRRYHSHYESSGHVWQGRFKAFPVQQDEHLLSVLRYIEQNPVRAGLVKRAETWRWSSLSAINSPLPATFLHPGPIPRRKDWIQWVNRSITGADLDQLRNSLNRGAPFGSRNWVIRTARRLGVESSLRPRGRPSKRVKG